MNSGFGPGATPVHRILHEAISAWARARPDTIAVRYGSEALTYGELEDRTDELAARLHDLGVRPGDAVGLFLKRSIEMVVGILAILKTGAAYVPQDARIVPTVQLMHICRTAKIDIILTLEEFASELNGCGTIVPIDRQTRINATLFKPARAPHPDDRCFILFTSGTTGKPNGVQVTHQNVANIILTSPGDLGMAPGTNVAHLLNIGFDMAAWEILGALTHGATLLIRGRDFTETARRANVIIATPSILAAIDRDQCVDVGTVAVAGEPCPRRLADEWSKVCSFYNCCGPTETTIVNTMAVHHHDKAVLSIGKPTANNTVYILDDELKPLPPGENGEMWAGGDCVTAGYIGDPELTAERYRPDPFRPGQMMFRTRDLGRWTETGELEHLGRVDDQVKVRGFRVELDGVSRIIEQTPGCRQAVALKFDDRYLVAFVSPADVDIDHARALIAANLPYYCMPLAIFALDELPRTSRGKIDKRNLLTTARTRIHAPSEVGA